MPADGDDASPITIAEVKDIARKRLPNNVWQYYETGTDDEFLVERNEAIYKELLLRPKFLRNVRDVDTSTTVFGKHYDFPIAIAPSAYQRLAGHQGEVDIARAAFALGTNLCLSSNATTSIEDTANALDSRDSKYPNPWFQLYVLGNRNASADLIRRAEAAGYEALVLTADMPVLGNRLHERKHALVMPDHLSMANYAGRKAGAVSKGRLLLNAATAKEAQDIIAEHSPALPDTSMHWDEVIPWLRSQTKMKVLVKGILTSEDAHLALNAGVDGIVVSNHGGRALDGSVSTLEALPEIVDAVRGRVPVIFDGGIRRGSDVYKALALGADLCLVGRPALWGLSYNGQKGVEHVLHILEREFWRTMTLTGVVNVKQINRTMLGKAKIHGFGIAKL
ncbi:FMN-dependent dehydrogenase [Aaosphaeria arxii CBS 175.79]|uniref:FMN-dependent dehydrogenase n=1 Tax=Aaosphaeria arxii CBS 175.79 TaxID=1450172 RepID=A0A6A5XR47_9PLEO|nr:FMN-dependent dehydrogenase [Aaosphaeria arxii CBS 175.79]KAF2015231.1 FMN-dependent dehydrogenase [Aaosphaeria arxii CBS 175.79]